MNMKYDKIDVLGNGSIGFWKGMSGLLFLLHDSLAGTKCWKIFRMVRNNEQEKRMTLPNFFQMRAPIFICGSVRSSIRITENNNNKKKIWSWMNILALYCSNMGRILLKNNGFKHRFCPTVKALWLVGAQSPLAFTENEIHTFINAKTSTVWFFATATKEDLITRLSDDLESSSWSQIKGFSVHFLAEVLVLKAMQMQYSKINCAIMLAFCSKAAFI